MANNSLYPGFVRYEYYRDTTRHVQILPVIPVLDAGTWKLTKNDATLTSWTILIDSYNAVVRPLMGANFTIVSAQLWTLASVTADPIFVAEYGLGLAGTGGGTGTQDGQIVWTYRTAPGGLLRHYLMEIAHVATNAKYRAPNFMNAASLALVNFMIGTSGFVRGRDGGQLVVCITQITKTNDALRSRRLIQI